MIRGHKHRVATAGLCGDEIPLLENDNAMTLPSDKNDRSSR